MHEGAVRMKVAVLVIAAALVGITLPARAEAPRAVVELFTSQGCSSCPPADKLLGELAEDPSIIALSLPVDYWDYLGWKDTLANPLFTARQRAYSKTRGDRDVYTPQMIVNGRLQVTGNDRSKIESTISAAPLGSAAIPVSLTLGAKHLAVAVGPTSANAGEIWVYAVSRRVAVTIGRGENRDRQVMYHNVVRRWLKVGDWNGGTRRWDVPLENLTGEGIDSAVVYIQSGSRERPGPIFGAAAIALR
jgi:hypothetical protein